MKCPVCKDEYYKGNIITDFCQFCKGKKDLDWLEFVMGIDEDHSNFLSNIRLQDEDIIIQASKNTSVFIYISYTAYIQPNVVDPKSIGIYIKNRIDCDDIWREYNRLFVIKYLDYQI